SIELPDEDIVQHLVRLRDALPSLVERYKLLLPYNLYERISGANTGAYIEAQRNKLQYSAEHYLFTESARAMHDAVVDGDMTWVPWEQDLWILHDNPVPFFENAALTQAIFLNKVTKEQQFQKYTNPLWHISVVDELGRNQLCILYDQIKDTYDPSIDYVCPWDECEDIEGRIGDNEQYGRARIACPGCQARTDIVAIWLHTALRMLRRDFARSANPQPFRNEEQVSKRRELVPRHHGKGKPKEREVERRSMYTVVDYEVSVSEPQPFGSSECHSEEEREAKRLNWLTLHGKERRVYQLKAIPDYTKTFTGPYWSTIINRCIAQLPDGQSGLVTIDGVEYYVDFDAQGNTLVSRTVNVPNGKYVPYLRPEFRQQPVIKRTTAKRFEAPKETE